ncbi:putative NADH-flavin reductase [Streptoalloteichus tenebrarius]|uniref:NADH-flavin reductase n=1 Tax=Streptoalloteichus tenebrarius (strain ATCC 17920 / DSM 40477 / JCM 4838 / CBS 697.72 / NBRC 16177 / NCIMB 11028 / NRRL B-12390 / A12253. 1 / ISP 5477) TaxID=1933 RepID=A0ABT1HM53_STRSD|nr:SDR family oxidoreductase [Streptoalloteichus tenebrarius]MCP2256578.1 putative NADH-flavin reductase [Streptoalloteichus tenebrarius]BFF04930.1 NAD(P)H-binding protein [Streptoalloteichus tenebrarius]
MKLTVFGASGGTGQAFVRQALTAGHEVTAVVRAWSRLPLDHPALSVVVADVFDPSSLASALSGADAVVSALGPRGRKDTTRVCSTAIRSILTAMADADVRRIVAVSAQPVLRTGAGEPLWFRATVLPIVRAVFREVYVDLELMERALSASTAEWTVLRPPYLTDKPAVGYRTALEASVPGGSLSRADLAHAMLDVLNDPTTVRHALGVGRAR